MFQEREDDWLLGQLTAAVEAVAREVLERPADEELDLAEAQDRLAEELERFWRELPLPELLSRLDAGAAVALLRPSSRVLAYVLSVALKAQLDAWQGRLLDAQCGIKRSGALFDA